MEQEKELVEVGNGGSEYCCRCFVLKKKMSDIEELERRIVELQVQNEVLLKSFPETFKGSDPTTNCDVEGEKKRVITDLIEDLENDKVLELMIENKVLECEKKKAESEVGTWKAKCEELELRVRVLEHNNLSCSLSGMKNVVKEECCDASTPLIPTSNGKERQEHEANEEMILLYGKRERYSTRRSRKQLNFGEETGDKMAPLTPAVGSFLPAVSGLIDISDKEDDDDEDETSSLKALSSGNRMFKDNNSPSKRRRASHIVHSDSECDNTDDDNFPLHRLRKRYSRDTDYHRKKSRGISQDYSNRGSIPTAENFTEDNDSEGESLNGFIGSGSKISTAPCVQDDHRLKKTRGIPQDSIPRQEHGANEEMILLQEKRERYYPRRSRKQLNFGEETGDKMAPLTPAAGSFLPAVSGLIDISDNEDDDDEDETSSLKALSSGNRMFKDNSTPSKRKRASHIVHSDNECDNTDDDNFPLHRLRKRYSRDADHRGISQDYSNRGSIPTTGSFTEDNDSEAESLNGFIGSGSKISTAPCVQDDHCRKKARGIPQDSIPTTGSFTDDETEDENESDSEDESLNDFIVSGDSESDISGATEKSEKSGTEESENNKSEGNVDYEEIISMIGRRKKKGDHLIKWEFEADMLSAFGKDPELCMKAVCALYRQQTSDEQSCKATIHLNQRGFSQFDAWRGSGLGEFLTDRDPQGGLKKTVEELLEFQPDGLDLCITLATHYSKQLFAMYENEEDPLWPALSTDS